MCRKVQVDLPNFALSGGHWMWEAMGKDFRRRGSSSWQTSSLQSIFYRRLYGISLESVSGLVWVCLGVWCLFLWNLKCF